MPKVPPVPNSTARSVPLPHESAELFRLMAEEVTGCAIFLTDAQGYITVWNRAAEVMKGHTAAQAVGQFFGLVYSPDDVARELPVEHLRLAAEHGVMREEAWRRRRDGSLFWALVLMTALRDGAGTLVGYSKMTLDLSRHKRLEQCIEEKEEARRLMEAAKAGSWSWNLATGRVSFSRALLALLHYTPDDVGGRFDDWRLFLRDDFDAFAERMRTMRELCPAVALETRVRLYGKAGDWRWFTLQGDWRWNDLDSSFRLLGVAIDVHEMTLQSEREHAQSTRLAAVLEQMPASADQTVVIEDYGRFNMAAPDGRPLRADKYPLARAVRGLRPVGPEVLLVNRPDGTSASFMVNAGSVRDGDGEARIAVSVMHSVELLVRTRTMLAIEKERAHITLRAIGDGVITTDPEGLVVTMNPAAERLTGYTAGVACEQGAQSVVALCDELGNAFARHPVIACLNSESATVAPLRGQLTSRAGTSHVVDFSVAPLRCDSGKLLGAVLVLRDMTEAQRLLDALTWQRTHDTLTGLINREGFGALLEAAVARCHGPGAGDAALLYLDLDQFKVVNETCGHDAGNALLCELGGAYGALAPASATLARIGGDEFALIIGNCSVAQAWDIADRLLEATSMHAFLCGGQHISLTVSIGLVALDGRIDTAEQAMRLADHACYIAKDSGRNRIFHECGDGKLMARRRKDMYWATRLAEAFRDDQFTLYAQPIRALAGAGTGLHYEVLLRMKNDGMAPIMPATFLPSAERFDIMTSVDRWVLDHSLAWLERHPEHVARLELCTINLSRRALADATFQRYVVALVEAGMTAPSKICFEITETGAIANMRTRLAFMRELKGLGCQFALDDFGTGTASFTYLKQLPVDYVKIDGSFIQGMATSHVDLEMVRFTNNISHFMGKKTIAEYVSNQATLDLLTELGVDYAQGFLVGKPAPLAA